MVDYTFMYLKIKDIIRRKKKLGEKIHIGFSYRHSEDEEEMPMYPELKCDDYILAQDALCHFEQNSGTIKFRVLLAADEILYDSFILHEIQEYCEEELYEHDSHFWSALIVDEKTQAVFTMKLKEIRFSKQACFVDLVCSLE